MVSVSIGRTKPPPPEPEDDQLSPVVRVEHPARINQGQDVIPDIHAMDPTREHLPGPNGCVKLKRIKIHARSNTGTSASIHRAYY